MNILIFDMDGVLLQPRGYHRALKDTVRLAGADIGFGEPHLSDAQIARFEALGISSEWHSSALCLAVMVLEKNRKKERRDKNPGPNALELEDLFEAIAAQPMESPALERGLAAVEKVAGLYGVPANIVRGMVAESESIQHSLTINIFQELILGSEGYAQTYQKPGRFQTESYLKRYDRRLLSERWAEKTLRWASQPSNGAAVMTNRPSNGPDGYQGAPDADLGASLVGLEALPLIGYGEISWLAEQTGREAAAVSKPAWEHALAAILSAAGWPVERSLAFVAQPAQGWDVSDLAHLHGGRLTIFEDTPGGVVAVQAAGSLLKQVGLRVDVRAVGIAGDTAKRSALAAVGATVFADIEQALTSLDEF